MTTTNPTSFEEFSLQLQYLRDVLQSVTTQVQELQLKVAASADSQSLAAADPAPRPRPPSIAIDKQLADRAAAMLATEIMKAQQILWRLNAQDGTLLMYEQMRAVLQADPRFEKVPGTHYWRLKDNGNPKQLPDSASESAPEPTSTSTPAPKVYAQDVVANAIYDYLSKQPIAQDIKEITRAVCSMGHRVPYDMIRFALWGDERFVHVNRESYRIRTPADPEYAGR